MAVVQALFMGVMQYQPLHYFLLLHVWNYTLSEDTGLFPQISYGLQCGGGGAIPMTSKSFFT
jgi:hypothetical protein